jgi:hypothetical protein
MRSAGGTRPAPSRPTASSGPRDTPPGAPAPPANGTAHLAPSGQPAPPNGSSRQAPGGAGRKVAPDSAALLRALDLVAARDAALAERDARIASLEQDRFELAGRLGYFQAQLEQAQATIKTLEAPKEPEPAPAAPRWPEEPTPADPPRPWWRFW